MTFVHFVFLSCFPLSVAPHNASASPVTWSITTQWQNRYRANVFITAIIPSGWRICAQRHAPYAPATFRFSADDRLITIGQPSLANTSLFFVRSPDIMGCYFGELRFIQQVSVSEPDATLKTEVSYIICQGSVCYPENRELMIPLRQHY